MDSFEAGIDERSLEVDGLLMSPDELNRVRGGLRSLLSFGELFKDFDVPVRLSGGDSDDVEGADLPNRGQVRR